MAEPQPDNHENSPSPLTGLLYGMYCLAESLFQINKMTSHLKERLNFVKVLLKQLMIVLEIFQNVIYNSAAILARLSVVAMALSTILRLISSIKKLSNLLYTCDQDRLTPTRAACIITAAAVDLVVVVLLIVKPELFAILFLATMVYDLVEQSVMYYDEIRKYEKRQRDPSLSLVDRFDTLVEKSDYMFNAGDIGLNIINFTSAIVMLAAIVVIGSSPLGWVGFSLLTAFTVLTLLKVFVEKKMMKNNYHNVKQEMCQMIEPDDEIEDDSQLQASNIIEDGNNRYKTIDSIFKNTNLEPKKQIKLARQLIEKNEKIQLG
ncbi:MAG: hypothetical protein CMF46_03260 [Legionellales bacterium]|nr:hypothetical protein [Legionellales bacterium]|tara:strand:- start:404 stop:1360 length:957 start_codon:yes stop_codon:yes gene_type:complete